MWSPGPQERRIGDGTVGFFKVDEKELQGIWSGRTSVFYAPRTSVRERSLNPSPRVHDLAAVGVGSWMWKRRRQDRRGRRVTGGVRGWTSPLSGLLGTLNGVDLFLNPGLVLRVPVLIPSVLESWIYEIRAGD